MIVICVRLLLVIVSVAFFLKLTSMCNVLAGGIDSCLACVFLVLMYAYIIIVQ